MARRIIGIETEYALAARGKRSRGALREAILKRIIELARERLPHLPDSSAGGIFLENGSRFYIDVGMHPEMCTPECSDPWDVVRYVKAGERILRDLVAQVSSTSPGVAEIQFLRNNVDYSGSGATWGCHESYLHRAPPSMLPAQILPHLVSRIIFAGAGGFDPRSPGLKFTLSPRVAHLMRPISSASTSNRGIFHTKDESLSGCGYHRLHLLCGNSLGSEIALWLTVATTAIVVALAEAGKAPGEGLEISDPVAAMRAFAADPGCRAEVQMANGRRSTALAIQRHYLDQAEACLGATFMPPWADEACWRWREMLDHLDRRSGDLWRTLDWMIKLALYDAHLRRRRTDWDEVAHWTAFVTRNAARLAIPEPDEGEILSGTHCGGLTIDSLIGLFHPHLKREGLQGADLERFLRLRQELFEIDTRFSDLGDRGTFDALDAAGALRHRMLTPASIERAMSEPPSDTRARLRGGFIKRVWGDPRPRACSWDGAMDSPQKRILNLLDPFEIEERWEPDKRNRVIKGERRLAHRPDSVLSEDEVRILTSLGISL